MNWRVIVGGVALTVTLVATSTAADAAAATPSSSLDDMKVENERKVGFRRALFSENLDADRDGCRTAEEVLIRDSTVAPTIGRRCRVRDGSWLSPYDGITATRASAVRVTPLVSLREAWESGAHSWSAARRADFANNVADLTAYSVVTSRVAAQKGDRDPSNWLPPLVSYQCTYVANWLNLKLAWGLSMDQSEFGRVRNVLASCGSGSNTSTTPTTASTATSPDSPAGASSAIELLSSIRVTPESPAGYSRSLFPHWKDLDGDGCDTREEVLIRDSITPAQVDPFGCQVRAGDWYSPYDGASWSDRGRVDIDHVVALKEAWDSGAHAWSTERRTQYANDLSDRRTLIAVTDSVNQSKSDKDPAQWMPPLASYHCTYLTSWVAVKARWGLSMDSSERNAVAAGLAKCPTTPVGGLPTMSTTVTNVSSTAPSATTQTTAPSGLVSGFVTPGAFCTPQGALGASSKGVIYTCKTSETDTRARWRR
jgi:hypothetical protein